MKIELSTADTDGNRKWVYPVVSMGIWWNRRRLTAILLIAWLMVAPWLKLGDRQLVFFDIVSRKIYFFGLSLWMSETSIFLFFILFLLSMVLFLTAILGRVFCGWACPQTVFMEFVFRPIERWLEGMGHSQKMFLKQPLFRRLPQATIKWSLFALISFLLGNTFIAYIFGSHQLLGMITDGPSEHMAAFFGMLISSLVIFFQFGWFREQVCLFVCPYGRLQSVLLDRDSIVVAYDSKRGEPRGRPSEAAGDCVDCKMCVKVCPTGIDIRNGLQMECIHCTQCIDACDHVMDKLKRPLGLIRYQTERELEGNKRRILRPRLFIYSSLCLIFSGLLLTGASQRKDFQIVTHRESGGQIFSVDESGMVSNNMRIQLTNYTNVNLSIDFVPTRPDGLQIVSPEGRIELKPDEKRTTHILLKMPAQIMKDHDGVLDVEFDAVDQKNFKNKISTRLLGPSK